LKIRLEQYDQLMADEVRDFVRRVYRHLCEHFPEECAAAGEQAVRADVRFGIERAESYGLESEVDLVQFIDVQMVFGRGFDTDPRCPWAREILESTTFVDPGDRADRLLEVAVEQAARRDGEGA
jgi:hypothetical protein